MVASLFSQLVSVECPDLEMLGDLLHIAFQKLALMLWFEISRTKLVTDRADYLLMQSALITLVPIWVALMLHEVLKKAPRLQSG
jgi:hypothetical protein